MQSYTHFHLEKYMDGEHHKFILGSKISLISGRCVVQFNNCRNEDGCCLTDHVGISCKDLHTAYWLFFSLPSCNEYEVECKVHKYEKGCVNVYTGYRQHVDFGLTDLKSIKVKCTDGYVLYNISENCIEQVFYANDENHKLHGSKMYHMYLNNQWKQFHDEQEYCDALRELDFNTLVKQLDSLCYLMCSLFYKGKGSNRVTQEYLNKEYSDKDKSVLDCLLESINNQLVYFKDKESFLMEKYREIESYYNRLPVS